MIEIKRMFIMLMDIFCIIQYFLEDYNTQYHLMSCCQDEKEKDKPTNSIERKHKQQKRGATQVQDMTRIINQSKENIDLLTRQNQSFQLKIQQLEHYEKKLLKFYKQISAQAESNYRSTKALLEQLVAIEHIQTITYLPHNKQMTFNAISNLLDGKNAQVGNDHQHTAFKVVQTFTFCIKNIIVSRKNLITFVYFFQIIEKIIYNAAEFDYTEELQKISKLNPTIEEEEKSIYGKVIKVLSQLKCALEKQAFDRHALASIDHKLQPIQQIQNKLQQIAEIMTKKNQEKPLTNHNNDNPSNIHIQNLQSKLANSQKENQLQKNLIDQLQNRNASLKNELQNERQKLISEKLLIKSKQQKKVEESSANEMRIQKDNDEQKLTIQNLKKEVKGLKESFIEERDQNAVILNLQNLIKKRQKQNAELTLSIKAKQKQINELKEANLTQTQIIKAKVTTAQQLHIEALLAQDKIIEGLKKSLEQTKQSKIKEQQQIQRSIQQKYKSKLSETYDVSRKQEQQRLSNEMYERNTKIILLQKRITQNSALMQSKISILQKETQQYKKMIGQLKQKNAILKQKNDELEREIIELKQSNRSFPIINQNLRRQLQQTKKLLMGVSQQLKKSSDQTNRVKSYSFVQHRTFFIGDLLEKRKNEKKFLIDSIQMHMKSGIEKTKLLYDFMRDVKTNFHSFIDGHSNLVLIVQTKKAVFAGYFSGKLLQEGHLDSQGLIVSLNNRQSYTLNNFKNYPKKDPKDLTVMRGMIFDKYYLIFGNAQIRIKSGQKKVFSNFGKTSSYFNSRGQKVHALLGEGTTNEIELVNYEIHEVQFAQTQTYEEVDC